MAPATARLVRTLGGPRVLGRRPPSLDALRERARAGLPYAALEAVAVGYAIDRGDLAGLLRLPPRTLARRKRARRLGPEESDRLLRVGRLAAQAEEVLGDRQRATRWLHEANRALGGRAPLGELDSDLGARQVEDVLVRIAHGVHS